MMFGFPERIPLYERSKAKERRIRRERRKEGSYIYKRVGSAQDGGARVLGGRLLGIIRVSECYVK